MSPRTRDDCERHQFKNSNKCSLYGGTMPLIFFIYLLAHCAPRNGRSYTV